MRKKISYRLVMVSLLFSSAFGGVGGGCCFSQTWSDVGGGVSGAWGGGIDAMTVFNNELYVSGNFPAAGSTPARVIARWNGARWDSVGININQYSIIYSFCEANGELYAGGRYTNLGGISAMHLAKWNGISWSQVSSSTPGDNFLTDNIFALNYKNALYTGGNFDQVGILNVNKIARFNGSTWDNVAGGVTGGFIPQVTCMAVYNGDLYVGGDFTLAGGKPANYIARWNGTSWDAVGSGFNDLVTVLNTDTTNNILYAKGGFNYYSTVPMYGGLAKWDGITWTSIGNATYSGNAISMAIYRGKLFLGSISATGSVSDTILTCWDGNTWKRIEGPNNTISALKVFNDTLYVGGYFNTVKDSVQGLLTVNYVAKYYEPQDTTCRFLQSVMYAYPPGSPKLYADTFKYAADSVAVEFYNNIASASSWQWDFGDSATGSGKTPIHYYTAGTYTVSVIVTYPYGPKGPCVDTVYRTITVINTTGVKEFQVESLKFKVYPNPSKGELTIEIDAGIKNQVSGIKMYDLQGKSAKEIFDIKNREIKISVADLPKGIYFVKLFDKEGKEHASQKVAVE